MTHAHPHDAQIRALYVAFIDGWNQRSGAAVSSGFADDGEMIGFDGSHTAGRLSIAAEFRKIFGSHQTPLYVALIQSVRPMADGVAVLHAHAGRVAPAPRGARGAARRAARTAHAVLTARCSRCNRLGSGLQRLQRTVP